MDATLPPAAHAPLTEARNAAERLQEHDTQRDLIISERDQALVQARRAGATWKAMEEATGLSTRGLSKALERAGA